MQPKFQIGQKVFKGIYERHDTFVTCPDCSGTKHVKVVLGDGTEILIECGGCDPGGYQPSTGAIKQYVYEARAKTHLVTGVKLTADEVEYELDKTENYGSYFTGNEAEVFATKEEAMAHANELKSQFEEAENKRLMAKTKDSRSWAWNATYHRNCIKRLEKELEYHRSKVTICSAHAKI